jgi:quercetin dioxygenase-like cupin family protein
MQRHKATESNYGLKGRIRLSIGTEEYEAQVGDGWCIPGGMEHGADILEGSVAIEVFSPVRDDYLPDGCETA